MATLPPRVFRARAFDQATRELEEFHRDVDSTFRGAEDELSAHAATANAHLTEEGWTEVSSFLNSWTNYGGGNETAAYRKDSSGRVWLKGMIKSGTVGSAAFTLPSGYRPPNTQYFAAIAHNGSSYVAAVLGVSSGGSVVPYIANNEFHLNGIAFYAS